MDNEKWIKAGKISAEALNYGKRLVKIDVSLLDVVNKVEAKIESLGGKPAFPVNLSINHIAAHNSPTENDKTKFKENDLVKLDLGVHVDGCIGDHACSIDLGGNKDLIDASQEALKEAVRIIKPGVKIREIGFVIQEKIKEFNFSPVRNLSGHSISEYNIHAGMTIPNYDNGDETELEEGIIIAVEPFATNGEGKVIDGKGSDVYTILNKKNIRNENARKILKEIEKYNGLPFAKRWITSPMKDFSFNLLEREKIIRQYPQLIENSKGLVSQSEYTLMVGKGVLTKI
tara:strand:+ start:45393 stop:46253 length:861 start_codon:yes stop_codon:yes gene_type:complete